MVHVPFSPPPPLSPLQVAFPAAPSCFSLWFSATLSSSSSERQSWCLVQTASVSTNPPRDRQNKVSESEKDEAGERRRELEAKGGGGGGGGRGERRMEK